MYDGENCFSLKDGIEIVCKLVKFLDAKTVRFRK